MGDTELEQLRRWKAEALPVMAGLQELGRALGLRPGEQITGQAALDAVERLHARLDASEPTLSDYDYSLEKVVRVKDGDTFIAILDRDIGFHLRAQANVTIRLLDVDTYEKNSSDPAQKILAQQATVFTGQWLMTHMGEVRVQTIEEDNFGRWLGHVYVPDGPVLAEDLVAAGFQKPGSKWGPSA